MRPVDAANSERRREIIIGAVHGLLVVGAGLHLVGAVADVVEAARDEETELADARVPVVAVKRVAGPEGLLAQVGIIHIDRRCEQLARLVERLARAQVDEAADGALDEVGRGILVDVDTGQQVGRHILEAELPPVVGGECVAAIEF